MILRSVLVFGAYAAAASTAHADGAAPAIDGNGWIAIAIILALVAVVVLMISGAISISGRDKPDGDEAGFGVLEGIDDDDDDEKPKKRR
jgi:hypothetical protein